MFIGQIITTLDLGFLGSNEGQNFKKIPSKSPEIKDFIFTYNSSIIKKFLSL